MLAKNILYGHYLDTMFTRVCENVNFKGYDARSLYALAMRNTDGFALESIAGEMREIGTKHGFKVLLEDKYSSSEDENGVEKSQKGNASFVQKAMDYIVGRNNPHLTSWMQDAVYFAKNQIIAPKNQVDSCAALSSTFGVQERSIPSSNFVQGGNLYILRDGDSEKILVGKFENVKDVSKIFPGREIVRIPQADFHIDLFVRPLKNNTVLVADDDMTLEMLQNAADKLEKLVQNNKTDKSLDKAYNNLCYTIRQMETGRYLSGYSDTNKVIKTLENNGFQVVRTPGRVYRAGFDIMSLSPIIVNRLNFMNAIAFEDENGELVYISNKSNLLDEMGIWPGLAEKIGLDFESEFKDAIAEHVKSENIYFMEGAKQSEKGIHKNIPYMLEHLGGGIHCLCAEVPMEIVAGE